MHSVLPLELLDTIVNELRDDVMSLRAYSYASSLLRSSAQEHLFSHITLLPPQSDTKPTPCERLYRILSLSPHLASSVKCLEMVEGYTVDRDPIRRSGFTWISAGRDADLAPLLDLLPLQRISLRCYNPGRLPTWLLSTRVKNSVCQALQSPILTSLHLGEIKFEPSDFYLFFDACSSLKELHLYRLSSRIQGNPEQAFDGLKPQLESLTISHCTEEILRNLLSPRLPLDLTHVRNLAIQGYVTPNQLEDLLKRPAGTLQHLGLWDHIMPVGIVAEEKIYLFKQHTSLKSFHISSFGDNSWPLLFEHCSSLERITIERLPHDFLKLSASEWKELDDLLTRPGLSNLLQVNLKVHPGNLASPTVAGIMGNARRYLPTLTSRGLLQVEEIPKATVPPSWSKADLSE
ncbi:hypothetical protein C8J57DRAFT_264509 [Mycena rebaudengoi]|nr:hypothetical protein C8J57DRAFT_264509 [Mycena rebaudengoi]